jgi:autotransporter translocation and assembly factor TamB
MRLPRVMRWTAIAMVILATAVAAALVVAQSDWGQERARQLIVSKTAPFLNGELSMRSLRWTLDGGAELKGVSLTQGGRPLFSAESIDVRYHPWRILTTGAIVLDEVVVTKPSIALEQREDGWNVARLLKPRRSTEPSRAAFRINQLQIIDGTLAVMPLNVAPRRLVSLNVSSDLSYAESTFRASIRQARALDPETNLPLHQIATEVVAGGGRLEFNEIDIKAGGSHVQGHVRLPAADESEIDVQLAADPLSLKELEPYFDAVRDIPLAPVIRVRARGTMDALAGDIAVESKAGNVSSTFSGGVAAGALRVRGDAAMTNLNIAPWFRRPDLISRITGRTTFDLTVPRDAPERFSVKFDAHTPAIAVMQYRAEQVAARGTYGPAGLSTDASGRAYGSGVRAHVDWRRATSTLATSGTFTTLDLRRLPEHLKVPALASNAGGAFDVEVTGKRWRANVTLDSSEVEEARIAPGTVVNIDARQPLVSYEIRGSFANVDPDRFKSALPTVPPALERLHGRFTAGVDLVGYGTTLEDADATLKLDLRDSVVSAISIPSLSLQGSIRERHVAADVTGEFGEVSSAALNLGDRIDFASSGSLVAHVDIADVTEPLTPLSINGDITMKLAGGRAWGMDLTTADVEASLRDGLADIRRLEILGTAARISANGPLALEGPGESALTYKAAVSDLSAFDALAGRSMKGSVELEGTITGPAQNATTAGTFAANSINVANVEALAAKGTFDATVRDRDFAHAAIKMKGDASFIEVGGMEIMSTTTTLNYDGVRLDVEALVEQPQRAFKFTGALVPHPEHQEVHVTSLSMTAGTTEWHTPPGREAVARYSKTELDVSGLELVRNDSRIRVDGSVGKAGASSPAPLVVQVERVQLQDVASLLLLTQKLTGQIDGTASVTGELSSPRVDANIAISTGSVNGVPFERLAGTAHYADRQLGLDMALEAGASGRLTAKGTMPVGKATEDQPLPPYDLRIESDAINLALFQPLVTHAEQLAGTGRFDLTVRGAAGAGGIFGTAAIEGASFTMAVTGVTYPRLDAKVTANGDQLIFDQFGLQDDDGHVATVAGTMKILERGRPGAFNLRVSAKDFHVLKNHFGELTLTPDLRVSGDLSAPLVVGTIEVERGVLEVSDLLERFGASGYRRSAETGAEQVRAAVDAQGRASGGSYSISLDFSDSLVLRGRDVRGTRGSIGMGDVNITLGGALTLAKDPGTPLTLAGEVEVVRGSYEFQGRRFNILPDSTLRFRGEEFLDPALDVTAERQIEGVTATVHVGGSMRQPEITLSSTPQLDQGDILSLIVFNQTMNELPTSQKTSLATRAGTLAARALATPIADSVARALDFDLFEVTPTDDPNGGAILTVGRQINDKLFVGFRQQLGADEVSQVTFEYRLTQFLRVVTSFAQGAERVRTGPHTERVGADFVFVIRR